MFFNRAARFAIVGDVLFAGDPGMPESEDATTRNLLIGGPGDDHLDGSGAQTRYRYRPGDGADTVTDEKGNSYYVVRVRTDRSTVGDKNLPIIPGMVAEVHVLTGKRTVLQYLLKPVLRAKANAFTER